MIVQLQQFTYRRIKPCTSRSSCRSQRVNKPILSIQCRASENQNGSQGRPGKIEKDEDSDIQLHPDDDFTVSGNSLSQNTELGRAVDSACGELEELNSLEMKQLEEAQNLLKKVGFKGNLFEGMNEWQKESLGVSEDMKKVLKDVVDETEK